MSVPVLVPVVAALWVAQAMLVSHIMRRRGFHWLPWLVVCLLPLGPAMWAIAVFERITGLPAPDVVRLGNRGRGPVAVFVLLARNELPEPVAEQVRRLRSPHRRLVLGRVLAAGGPTAEKRDAEGYLRALSRDLAVDDAELRIFYGNMPHAVRAIHDGGEFGLVLRSDQPQEIHDPDEVVRCRRDIEGALSA